MTSVTGQWYDSRTSAQVDAVCHVYDSGTVRVERLGDGKPLLSLPRFDVKASPRLGNTPRRLYFPGGENLETRDNDAVDRLMNRFGRRSRLQIVHVLESHKRYVLLALAGLLIFLWGSFRYGVPLAAKMIAYRLPPSVQTTASRHTLEILDRSVFQPSELGEAVQGRLTRHFVTVLEDHPSYKITVEFRKGAHVGPNAFALPDGTIIFTDEMVGLAANDDELLAVLTHEIGHIAHRHAMRTVIQDSLLGFALLAITGDVSGSSELFLGLPVLLTEMAYSRQFEREADQYALGYLRSRKIPPSHFARLMRRIEEKASLGTRGSGRRWLDYVSTHPETEDRFKVFEEGLQSGQGEE